MRETVKVMSQKQLNESQIHKPYYLIHYKIPSYQGNNGILTRWIIVNGENITLNRGLCSLLLDLITGWY